MHAIGERYRTLLEKPLKNLGINVLWLPNNPDVDPRLAGHADLSLYTKNDTIIAAHGTYPYIVNSLTKTNLSVLPAREQRKLYPHDAGLCVCSTGKYDIYNPRTIDPCVLEVLDGIPIHVNQGYSKCSVCVVSPDGIITSDPAIASKAMAAGMDVLHITPGHILLDGFDYGFIGGASFSLDEETLAFTGTLASHPDESAILAFLKKNGVKPIFLTNIPIFDIGGAISLP